MQRNEIWKDVVGYEKFYQVSDLGRLRSKDRIQNMKNGVCRNKESQMLKITKNTDGYYRVCLYNEKSKKNFNIHRLVLIAFRPTNNSLLQVNHINGIKKNNRLSNLEWVTAKENIIHAIENKLRIPPKGEFCFSSKLTLEQVIDIKKEVKIRKRYDITILSKKYNVSKGAIGDIISGKNWKHVEV